MQLGGWNLTASLSLGLGVSLNAYAKMKAYVCVILPNIFRANFYVLRTVPFTIDSPKGSAAWKNFFGDSGSTLNLTPDVKAPILNKKDAEAKICTAVAIGPSASLSLVHKDFPSVDMSIGARLDLPRVSLCAALAQGNLPTACGHALR